MRDERHKIEDGGLSVSLYKNSWVSEKPELPIHRSAKKSSNGGQESWRIGYPKQATKADLMIRHY